jgi:hypothetical protein
MNCLRILLLAVALAGAGLAPATLHADEPVPGGALTEPPAMVHGDGWNGPGGLYQVMATSLGVIAGATAMSLFIDGWVVDLFTSSSGITVAEAVELVQDLESYGGLEAAAVVLSGLAGGLIAERLYVQADHLVPPAVAAVEDAFRPTFHAVGNLWISTSDWMRDRAGDTSDWVQTRSRELWDRWQLWMDDLSAPNTAPAPMPGPVHSGPAGS